MISASALQERLTALTAFVLPVRSHKFRQDVMEKIRPPSRSRPLVGRDKNTTRPPGAGSPVDTGSKAPGGSFELFFA